MKGIIYIDPNFLFFSILGFSVIELLTATYNLPILFIIKAFFIFIYIAFLVKSFQGTSTNIWTNKLFICLLLWTIIIFFMAFQLDYNYFRNQLLLPYLVMPFTFPFLARQLSKIRISSILKVIHYSNLLYLFFFFLYFPHSGIINPIGFTEISGKYFAYSNIFMLLFFDRLKNRKYVSLLVFFISLGLALFYGRRAMSFILILGCILPLLLIFKQEKSLHHRFFIMLFLVLAFFLGLKFYNNHENPFFSNMKSRLLKDTRSAVELEFYNDMSGTSFIFGRGIGGTFTSYYAGLGDYKNNMQRNGIETGFLDYILKGGLIYLFLMVSIYLIAMFNGFFKSKNIYSKYLATFLLLYIIELYPSGTILFNLRSILLWFCITLLFDKRFLFLNDAEISKRYI